MKAKGISVLIALLMFMHVLLDCFQGFRMVPHVQEKYKLNIVALQKHYVMFFFFCYHVINTEYSSVLSMTNLCRKT